MITKEILKEAIKENKRLKQVYGLASPYYPIVNYKNLIKLEKPIYWRFNGKLKEWKRDKARFEIPIKHGLHTYGKLENINEHLFIIE